MGVARTDGNFGVPIRGLSRSQSAPIPLPYALPERWTRTPTNKQHFCLTIPWRRKQVIARCSLGSFNFSIFNRTYYKSSGNGIPNRIDKGLTCFCFKRKGNYEEVVIHLTAQQEERLKRLRCRMKVQFDASRPDHQDALKALWSATYPERKLCGLISDQWKEMGWQGKDPSTDFRGSGFISLENLLFFAKTFPISFQHLLKKQGGERSVWEYPFAVAGVNITFMIKQMLDLEASKRRTLVRSVFLHMLSENEWAFDLLYCVAFAIMDKQWLKRNATYMEFNDILRSTRAQMEQELLMDGVLRIEDMPSYTLLT